MINLRGRVIPVVDLRRRFGLTVAEASPEMRILVVDIAGEDIGVIVDAVTEVKRIAGASVQRDALVATTDQAYYLEGIAKIGDQLLILLDLERALVKTPANTATAVAEAA
jgi:purine-binding chemotaxis protein CheW